MTGTHRIWSVCALALSLLALPLTILPAAADPIPIVSVTSGSAVLQAFGLGSRFDLHGTDGFSFVGGSDSDSAATCSPCVQGEVHDFSGRSTGSYLATGTFRSQSFPFDLDNGGGDIVFTTGLVTMPPQSAARGTIGFQMPFSLASESFLSFQPQPLEGNLPFSVGLQGGGTLTVLAEFFNDPELGTLYTSRDLRFDFGSSQQPPPTTPEPASLILLATGVGIACCGRRKGASD